MADFKKKTGEEIVEMSAEEQIKYYNDLNEARNKELEDLKTKLKEENKEEIQTQIDSLKEEISKANKEQYENLTKALETQGIALKQLMASKGESKQYSLKSEIESNKEKIDKAVNKEVKEVEFTVKADTTRASVADSTQAFRLQDIGQLAHRKLTARDIFPVVTVGAGSNGVIRYADWDADTTVRAAAMRAEGGTFPESTAKWEEKSLTLKKIGDSIPVTEEMVQDAGRFADELDMFLRTNVAIVEDTQLITGDGTGNNMTGIYTSAPTYTPTGAGITDASIYDLIVKLRETISKDYGSKYQVNVVMMNIADINKMKLKKDANNNYIIPPFVDRNGQVVDGALVLETNALTANTMVIGDNRFAKIYEVEGINVSLGYTDTQFTEDLMTMKARQRENLLVREVDKTGFLKVTDIDAALVALTA